MFNWDRANQEHVRRHRVQPHEAEEALNDPQALPVDGTDLDEARDAIIGLTSGGWLLVVVFTFREDQFRVITARVPSAREARLYWRR